ncbi:hypothetical protein HMPREF0281_01126 [Corynebacterium ammoniagenes DSM 20306]|jgi:hypothetical protein|uniref:Uncharacterized protein n=2 Tax=Corynebacterium ammoniagenes TaxID=1697 RepID=A0AAV5G8F2_CORAM|nr:carboxylate/amino acid/amine transporter [Corynebacterium ammoniagenes]EFG81762.1 hypothetical protein HMPREF0281_01126 [Corynebacterium ammoniagenes DSM 20306]GJN43326.1 hypothetical protein CAT723_18050 [Corynebacterium ammoniagenes]
MGVVDTYFSVLATFLVLVMLTLLFIKRVPRWVPAVLGGVVIVSVWVYYLI